MTSQVTGLPVEPQIAVEGSVQKSGFESLVLDRILTRLEGESATRAVAAGLAALPLLPLIALYDLVRYGLFKYGKCDGKSWSLIGQASEALAALSGKVKSAVEKKEVTTEDLNAQSEQKIRSHVERIVDGFRALNSGEFFDSAKARKGERQIAKGKDFLAREIAAFLDRNVGRAEHFAAYLASVRNYVAGCFVEVGKDDVFVPNKVERTGPQPLLSEWAKSEFEQFLIGNKHVARSFSALVAKNYSEDCAASLARREEEEPGAAVDANALIPPDALAKFVSRLKLGVDQKLISPEQAREQMQGLIQGVYSKAIAAIGPKGAVELIDTALAEGVRGGLLSEEESIEMGDSVFLSPEELAAAVVANLVQYRAQHPSVTPATLDQKISYAARVLRQQGILASEDEVEFLNAAKDGLAGFQAEWDAQAEAEARAQEEAAAAEALQAQLAAEEAAALQAKQEADALEAAQQAEAAEKALEERQNLTGLINYILGDLSEQQEALFSRYDDYEALAAERGVTVDAMNKILNQKITVGSKQMTILQAYEYNEQMRAKIIASGETPEEQEAKLVAVDEDLSASAIDLIAQLHNIREVLNKQTRAMDEILKVIEQLDLDLARDVAAYQQLAKEQRGKLDEETRQQIEALERVVLDAQRGLVDRYRKAHNLSSHARLPSDDVQPGEVNVPELLEMYRLADGVPSSYAASAPEVA